MNMGVDAKCEHRVRADQEMRELEEAVRCVWQR
jgi:hypothetical protein